MVTKSRDYSDIRSNMITGLDSLDKHDVPYCRIVLANPGMLGETYRRKLREAAAERGATLEATYGRRFFASRLRRDGQWRERLLGLSGASMTVSRVPWRLAEGSWSELPLVGRQRTIDEILGGESDVILVGKPGVGKTRVLSALPDVAFIDTDAGDDSQIADDLRWVNPAFVAIDDVGATPDLVDLVQRLRRQDQALEWHLVVACWPDEVERVRTLVPGAVEILVDLLERPDIDEIVRSMGATAVMARQVILDQAEGRPGWAVSLADILLKSGWTDLLTGKALLGEVDGYLRRSQIAEAARDLLAVVAALRGVDEKEVVPLAEGVGLTRAEAGRLLRAVAKGGLLEEVVRFSWGGPSRQFLVRPAMLADALAAEHFFFGEVPLGDIDKLLDSWPSRRVDLVRTVCTAAQMESDRARGIVDDLVDSVVDDSRFDVDQRLQVLQDFVLIDERAGEKVVDRLHSETSGFNETSWANAITLLPIVNLAHLAAVRYGIPRAVTLLLHAAAHDRRDTNPHPEHPLRKLADMCTNVHPDLPPTPVHRVLVGSALDAWLPDLPNDDEWRVWAAVASSVLTPHARAAYTAPEDMFTFSMIETVVPPEYAALINEQLWPPILNRLAGAPSYVASQLVPVVHAWLCVGGGYDQPFGVDHPDDAVAAAHEVGLSILMDVVGIAYDRPALIARLSSTAAMFDIELPEDLRIDSSAFYRNVEIADDIRSALDNLARDIASEVNDWANDPPRLIVERLIQIRHELVAAGMQWPDRVGIACQAIAERADDARPWVEDCLALGLFPEAGAFMRALLSDDCADNHDLIKACLEDGASRTLTLESLLAGTIEGDLLGLAIGELRSSDYRLLDGMTIQGSIPLETQREILRSAHPKACGVFAVALAGRADDPLASVAEELRDDWLAAVEDIDLTEVGRDAEHQLAQLIPHLASSEPDVLEALVRSRLEQMTLSAADGALGHDGWRCMHVLPAANKAALLATFDDTPSRWLLLEHLVGPDIEWLETLLEDGLVTPAEALNTRSMHGRIPIDRMASLLVPRGIAPNRIAALAMSGTWVGEESAHYESLVGRFSEYAESHDENVSAVGLAGMEMYIAARDASLEHERIQRIQGAP